MGHQRVQRGILIILFFLHFTITTTRSLRERELQEEEVSGEDPEVLTVLTLPLSLEEVETMGETPTLPESEGPGEASGRERGFQALSILSIFLRSILLRLARICLCLTFLEKVTPLGFLYLTLQSSIS